MDGRISPIHPTVPCNRIDADAGLADSVRESSSVIYFASAEEVSEGFALALNAMGFEEVLLPDILQFDVTSKPEGT
jgi:hypothetical protein